MKILFLNYEYPPLGGGAANATAQLLSEYVNMPDMEVHLVTSAQGSQAEEIHLGGQVYIHRLPIGKNPEKLHSQSLRDIVMYSLKALAFSWQLVRREKDRPFDATLAFFGVPCGFLAMLLKWCFGLPYVVSLRGSDVPGYSAKYSTLYVFIRPLIQLIWSQASAVVPNSQGLKELALVTAPKQSIDIIFNGVDTKRFFPAPEQRPEHEFIITPGASRVTSRKGLRYLVEAVAQLAPRFPALRLKILGDSDGSERVMLDALVQELHVEERVEFVGRVPREETTRYYQEASLFVLPSQNEGMSNALLEALACGLPAIMTPTGGAVELIEEGRNGFIVPYESGAAIANVLEIFLLDPEKVRSFGIASRDRALQMSWSTVAKQFVAILKQASQKEKRV